ncbi:uncharacterized protein LOC144451608 [Glandiceps talaboti]
MLEEPVELAPSRIVQKGAIENEMSTMKEWIENDPVLKYVNGLSRDAKDGFQLHKPLSTYLAAFKEFLQKYTSEHIERGELSENVIDHIHALLARIYDYCARNDSAGTKLDKTIDDIMRIAILHHRWGTHYDILLRSATRTQFEVCGTKVTSDTNVLLLYVDEKHKSFPVILSQNKTGNQNKEYTAPVHRKKKIHMEHKNIAQVIGQSLSVGDESPFETDDYKIVYHISLMSLSELVINRTHLAKSTLTEMKAGCVPTKKKPLPSYVLEKLFFIGANPIIIFNSLYMPIFTLMKAFFIMYNPAECDKEISKPSFKEASLKNF